MKNPFFAYHKTFRRDKGETPRYPFLIPYRFHRTMYQHMPPEFPRISVIIPVHDVAPYPESCPDSLAAQAFRDWEAVCIDDGSGEILDRYAEQDGRIMAIHQRNGGASAARKAGLQLARGTYIQMPAPDNWTKPGLEGRTPGKMDGKRRLMRRSRLLPTADLRHGMKTLLEFYTKSPLRTWLRAGSR